jgi:ParB family transcriptional regulator, chromosome partitioning protein
MQEHFVTAVKMKGIVEEVDCHKIQLTQFKVYITSSEQDHIDELALSIKRYGLLHPITIRIKDTSYEIVAGNRRYLACKKLGWRKIPCHITELDDKEAFEIFLIENIHRKQLNPIDEGRAFKAYVTEYGWGGISELSNKISKSIPYISKRISMIDLPRELIEEIEHCNIQYSVAETLLYVKDKDIQLQVAKQAIEHKLPVRKVKELINQSDEIVDVNDNNIDYLLLKDDIIDIDLKAQNSFDKSITTLKMASRKLAQIVKGTEDNWILYEILMQHKSMLDQQIDILIKEKKKL